MVEDPKIKWFKLFRYVIGMKRGLSVHKLLEIVKKLINFIESDLPLSDHEFIEKIDQLKNSLDQFALDEHNDFQHAIHGNGDIRILDYYIKYVDGTLVKSPFTTEGRAKRLEYALDSINKTLTGYVNALYNYSELLKALPSTKGTISIFIMVFHKDIKVLLYDLLGDLKYYLQLKWWRLVKVNPSFVYEPNSAQKLSEIIIRAKRRR